MSLRRKPLTHAQRQELIHRPFLPIRTFGTSYPWGGVQVIDTFFGEVAAAGEVAGLPMQRIYKNHEYDGIYKDAVNLSQKDAIELFGEAVEH